MDEGRLKGILSSEIDDAIGYLDTETSAERAKAMDYYLRKPYGNEVEGRSQIITAEVAEAVDGEVQRHTAKPIDTSTLSKGDLDKMLFILDSLRDGKRDDRGSSGHK